MFCSKKLVFEYNGVVVEVSCRKWI